MRLLKLRRAIRDVVLGHPEIASLNPDEGDCVAGQALSDRSKPTSTATVSVSSWLLSPQKTKYVAPAYPLAAAAAHVEGVVIVEVIIGMDGKIRDAMVLRSVPPLDQAALDAVRQWEFAPTMLNGNPIPVVLIVAVKFPP